MLYFYKQHNKLLTFSLLNNEIWKTKKKKMNSLTSIILIRSLLTNESLGGRAASKAPPLPLDFCPKDTGVATRTTGEVRLK